MSYSLKSSEHYFKIAKELSEDEVFSDMIFHTETGCLYGHAALILPQIPAIAGMLCQDCRTRHHKISIFLPQVRTEFMEMALLDFYLKGDADKLRDILGVSSVNTEAVKEEVLEDTGDLSMDNNFSSRERYVSVIQYRAGSDTAQQYDKISELNNKKDAEKAFKEDNTFDDKELLKENLLVFEEASNRNTESRPTSDCFGLKKAKRPKSCQICAKVFQNRYNLKQHLISRHKIFPPKMKIYKCDLQKCDFVTGSRIAFERHLTTRSCHPNVVKKENKKEKDKIKTFCTICEQHFATKSSCQRHLVRKHNGDVSL